MPTDRERALGERRDPPASLAAPAPGAGRCLTPDSAADCPQCGRTMRLWAGFHRCPACGYKESCCF